MTRREVLGHLLMSKPLYGRKVDKNHARIRDTLRELMFTVEDTSQFGQGFPDLMVKGYDRFAGEQAVVFVEVKAKGKAEYKYLTKAEKEWYDMWHTSITVIIADKVSDVLIYGFGWRKVEAEACDW